MSSAPEVIVIGGGIVGWSTAWELCHKGFTVEVVERGNSGQATNAGAGIIAPGTSFRAVDAFFPLAQLAVAAYPAMVALVEEASGLLTGYETVGALFIARDEDELGQLPAAMQEMERRRDEGMANIGTMSMLSGAAARDYFPPLADVPAAILIPEAARVNGRSLRDAIRQTALNNGVQERLGNASLGRDGNRATIVVDGDVVLADHVVISGGAWSNTLGDALGFRLPVYPQRGQIIHLDLPEQTTEWPIVEGFFTHYLLAFRPNRIVAGATREHDSGYDARVTVSGVQEVLGNALSIAPGLADATVAEIRVGLRPFSPDTLPVLGRAPGVDNAWLCTGHGPSGLQLGPFSGTLVAGMIAGEAPPLDVSPFRPERYAVEPTG